MQDYGIEELGDEERLECYLKQISHLGNENNISLFDRVIGLSDLLGFLISQSEDPTRCLGMCVNVITGSLRERTENEKD